MPRRIATRNSTADSATPHAPSPGLAPQTFLPSDVLELRRQWKWAAFSQFFFTFAPLFNMDDVSIAVSTLLLSGRHQKRGALVCIASWMLLSE